MSELAFEENRKKEYLEKKSKGETDFFDDYADENRSEANNLLKKRENERLDVKKRKQERMEELKKLADKGTLYIKGGLK
jgi:hypothetical protein